MQTLSSHIINIILFETIIATLIILITTALYIYRKIAEEYFICLFGVGFGIIFTVIMTGVHMFTCVKVDNYVEYNNLNRV